MGGTPVFTAEDPALKQIAGRLADVYRPERMYLFGPVASGEAGPDSDHDLLVVMPDDSAPDLSKSRAGYRASRDYRSPATRLSSLCRMSLTRNCVPARRWLPR